MGIWMRVAEVPSTSSNRTWIVSQDQDNQTVWGCSCPGWTRHMPRRDCRHIDQVKGALRSPRMPYAGEFILCRHGQAVFQRAMQAVVSRQTVGSSGLVRQDPTGFAAVPNAPARPAQTFTAPVPAQVQAAAQVLCDKCGAALHEGECKREDLLKKMQKPTKVDYSLLEVD